MKYFYSAIYALIILFISCQSQSDSYSNIVYSTDFEDIQEWFVDDSTFYFDDNTYSIETNLAYARSAINVDLDYSKDFEIEASFISEYGADVLDSFGLIWGATIDLEAETLGDVEDAFSLFLISNGADFHAGDTNKDSNWILSESINTGDGSVNVLKVQKIESEYHFFINNQLVQSLPFTMDSIFGRHIGLMTHHPTDGQFRKIKMNYITIQYLETKEDLIISDTGVSEPQFLYTAHPANYAEDIYNIEDLSGSVSPIREGLDAGELHIVNNNIESSSFGMSFPYDSDSSQNFDISARFKFESSDNPAEESFQVGWGDEAVQINKNGEFYHRINNNGEWETTSITGTVNAYDYNDVIIKKRHNKYKIYLNDEFVVEFDYSFFTGNMISTFFSHSGFLHELIHRIQPKGSDKEFGNYYALMIGVNEYDYLSPLSKPISDVKKLKRVLEENYNFDKVYTLENPDRNRIIKSLEAMAKRLDDDDNLLIYFSGHGIFKKARNGKVTSYWMPKDGELESTANWIPDSKVQEIISDMKAKHVLVMSDACFMGDFLQPDGGRSIGISQSVRDKYNRKSRKIMTAGDKEVVPDLSKFNHFIVNELKYTDKKFISSKELYQSIRNPIIENTKEWDGIDLEGNYPQRGIIGGTGDESGDFIFVKKGYN